MRVNKGTYWNCAGCDHWLCWLGHVGHELMADNIKIYAGMLYHSDCILLARIERRCSP